MPCTLSDCIAALTTALGAPVSHDADHDTRWGVADAERPSAYIGDGDGECVVIDLYPKGVTTQTRIYVAETIPNLAASVVCDAYPRHGVILPLADAVAAARIAMGRDRMPLDVVDVELSMTFGFPDTAGNPGIRTHRWTRDWHAVERTEQDDGTVMIALVDDTRRVEHVIAETTDTPVVIDCRTVTDALYRSGACTLAVALKAAQACLANGLPADAVLR